MQDYATDRGLYTWIDIMGQIAENMVGHRLTYQQLITHVSTYRENMPTHPLISLRIICMTRYV